MNNTFFEICEMSEEDVSGRVKVKMSALEVHPTTGLWNKNGLTWLEEYIQNNIKSAMGMDYVVSWMDEENQIPSGHGEIYHDENGNLQFNGVVVGSVQSAYLTDVEINGEMKKVMMTEGYINSQRYGKFVKWLREEMKNNTIYGSIEINGKAKSRAIEYLDGSTNPDGTLKMGRIPTVFDFTGLAIMHNIVEPADNNSQIFELNSKNNEVNKDDNSSELNKLNSKEAKVNMDEKVILELNQKIEDKTNEINSLTKTIETKTTEINSLTEKLTTTEAKVAELNSTLVDVNKVLETIKVEKETLAVEVNAFREEKAKADTEKAKAEVNAYFETEIVKNGFEEAEVNSLKEYVEKVDLEGLKKAEAELCAKKFKDMIALKEVEVNAKQNLFIPVREEKIPTSDIEAGKGLFHITI